MGTVADGGKCSLRTPPLWCLDQKRPETLHVPPLEILQRPSSHSAAATINHSLDLSQKRASLSRHGCERGEVVWGREKERKKDMAVRVPLATTLINHMPCQYLIALHCLHGASLSQMYPPSSVLCVPVGVRHLTATNGNAEMEYLVWKKSLFNPFVTSLSHQKAREQKEKRKIDQRYGGGGDANSKAADKQNQRRHMFPLAVSS